MSITSFAARLFFQPGRPVQDNRDRVGVWVADLGVDEEALTIRPPAPPGPDLGPQIVISAPSDTNIA